MKFGFAETNITPPVGEPIPGQFHKRVSTGILDELFVKAMVVESEGMELAVVSIDIHSLERQPVLDIRSRITRLTGIPGEHVMVSATHIHSGGPTKWDPAEAYYQLLVSKAADAVALAKNTAKEAVFSYYVGRDAHVAFNRRFLMKDGSYRTNPGIGSPDIVRAAGPIDPDVTVLRVDDLDGNPLGVLSNYACHTDCVGGQWISADYPGAISGTVKGLLGPQTVSLFLQGACGNINHLDTTGLLKLVPQQHHVLMGRVLGAEVLKARELAQGIWSGAKLGVLSEAVAISSRVPAEAETARARELLATLSGIPDAELTNRQNKDKRIALNTVKAAEAPPVERSYEVQAVHIGDLAFVALPSEVFVEFGLEIKRRSPFPVTIVCELANGSGHGYICTREAYIQGGYEPTGHKFAIGAGEALVETAIQLLHRLTDNHPVNAQPEVAVHEER